MKTCEVYDIIRDEGLLVDFIDNWLPELEPHEGFVLCLFSRRKYSSDRSLIPHMRDQHQCRRELISDKTKLFSKIRGMEVPVGSYHTRGSIVPEETLALYINPVPRDLRKSILTSMEGLVSVLKNDNPSVPMPKKFHPDEVIFSSIHRSPSKNTRSLVHFDIDIDEGLGLNEGDILQKVLSITEGHCQIMVTRGGYHVFVESDKLTHCKFWYKEMTKLSDVKGDCLMPVPGCTQGGFVPRFINTKPIN